MQETPLLSRVLIQSARQGVHRRRRCPLVALVVEQSESWWHQPRTSGPCPETSGCLRRLAGLRSAELLWFKPSSQLSLAPAYRLSSGLGLGLKEQMLPRKFGSLSVTKNRHSSPISLPVSPLVTATKMHWVKQGTRPRARRGSREVLLWRRE